MKNKILIKRFSECCFPETRIPLNRGFSIWENGCYYSEQRQLKDCASNDFERSFNNLNIKQENPERILALLFKYCTDKNFTQKKTLVFKSSLLAEKIKNIIERHADEIKSLPEYLNNLSICDGYYDYLKIRKKKIEGNNFLTEVPYKHYDESSLNKLTEDERKNKAALVTISNFYSEIQDAIENYKKQIHDFAFENMNPFINEESQLSFGEKCEALGFKMDSGESFYKAFPDAYKSADGLRDVIEKIKDVDLLGSAIYSKWRYFTNWALANDEKPIDWFRLSMTHLAQLVIECFEKPSLTRYRILSDLNLPEDNYIHEYYETNNLIYTQVDKEKYHNDFICSLGVYAKWKDDGSWFTPNFPADLRVYNEIKNCKNLAELLEKDTYEKQFY